MLPKKFFLPLGGGEELEERIRGALLISKFLEAHLEVLRVESTPQRVISSDVFAPKHLVEQMAKITHDMEMQTSQRYKEVFEKICSQMNVKVTSDVVCDGSASASLLVEQGVRGEVVAQYSKLCDMVIAVCPPENVPTATFEAAVLYSGKPVIMIPRVLKQFNPERIIVFWNASTEASRAIDGALEFLKRAKDVMIVTRDDTKNLRPSVEELKSYLEIHNIKAQCSVVRPTKIVGEALLNKAVEGNYGLIVAGAYGVNRIKEKMFGGLTTYMLKHTQIPVLTAH
ncbi:MAG: universal stress protein [Sulfurospirillaceae bacterium]|nr:universal stress protein [Sulfurospirillaceae bacterium]